MKKILALLLTIGSISDYSGSCLKEIIKAGGNVDAVGSSLYLNACKRARSENYNYEMGSCIKVMASLGGHPDSVGSSLWINACTEAAKNGYVDSFNEFALDINAHPGAVGSSLWINSCLDDQ